MDCCTGVEPTHNIKSHDHGTCHDHSEHHASHHDHSSHHGADFLPKFWISIILTIPIIFYSELPKIFFDWSAPEFIGSEYLSLVLGVMVFFYCGWIFLSSAWYELKSKKPGMMTLIALAITTAFTWSVYSTLFQVGHSLWWELSTLIAIMLLGHWIEMKSVMGAEGALNELAKLLPDVAEVMRGNESTIVPIHDLHMGDIVIVRPGSKVPVDGKIIDGRSDLNESIITGESRPVEKTVGQEVIAGSLNGDGSLRVEVTKIGEDTFLAGVIRLIAEAQSSKSRLQMLSDRAAFWLTLIAIIAGAITLVSWLIAGATGSVAIQRLVAVLVIACPHALGLAIPLVASISTTMAARNGFLIRNRLALEDARKINVVLFDKTGTLTEAKFKVTSVTSEQALILAASVNSKSEHPIAKAMVDEAKIRSLTLFEVSDFQRVAGRGVRGVVQGKSVFVGTKGDNDIVVEQDGEQIGRIEVMDAIRPESKKAVEMLKSKGVRVAMITGDSEIVAKQVAEEIGLDEYFARVLPEDKVNKVRELQAQGLKVAMVGDGVNDAPALALADVGIAVGAGTNVAIESAGIILVKSDPRDIPKIITLSKLTYSKMIQNLFWATGYNIVAMPVAAGALAPWGIVLEPAVAAVFMSLSTVIVAISAVMLRRRTLS